MSHQAEHRLTSPSFFVLNKPTSSEAVQTLDDWTTKEETFFDPTTIERKYRRRAKKTVKVGNRADGKVAKESDAEAGQESDDEPKEKVQKCDEKGKTVRVSNEVFCFEKKPWKEDNVRKISKTKKIFVRDVDGAFNHGLDLKKPVEDSEVQDIKITDKWRSVCEYHINKHIFFSGIRRRDRRFIFAKLGRTSVKEIGWKKMDDHIRVLKKAIKAKPNVKRGKERIPVATKFACFGTRPDRLTSVLGSYVYKNSVSAEDRKEMDRHVLSLVQMLEEKASLLMSNAPNLHEHNRLKKDMEIPTMGKDGCCTQFCVGQNYWAPMHSDNDYYYTTLSCFTSNKDERDEILYHFTFPEYEIAVPMRHGDVLVFDPRIMHCSSNPRKEEALIVSAYVSKKVVVCHIKDQLELLHGLEE